MANHIKDIEQTGFNATLLKAFDLLEEASMQINSSDLPDKKEIAKEIGMAMGYVVVAGSKLPGFSLSDGIGTPDPDGDLSDEQQARVDQLSDEELRKIDDALLSYCSFQYRKVARVVGTILMERDESYKGIPDIFYSQRVTKLVESGRLEHQGRLGYMRFCEVRLPQENASHELFPDGEEIPQKS
jgi:hypothetical protein